MAIKLQSRPLNVVCLVSGYTGNFKPYITIKGKFKKEMMKKKIPHVRIEPKTSRKQIRCDSPKPLLAQS